MNLNREDIVQSALNIQRWCEGHIKNDDCDCPFNMGKEYNYACILSDSGYPISWNLEKYLRNRGSKYE